MKEQQTFKKDKEYIPFYVTSTIIYSFISIKVVKNLKKKILI